MNEDGCVCMCKSEYFSLRVGLVSETLLFKRNSTKNHESCSSCTMWLNHSVNNVQSCRDTSTALMEFTGNVLRNFVVCLIILYVYLRPTQHIW